MTYVEKINAVLQKLKSSQYSIDTRGNSKSYIAPQFTREEIGIIYMCCYQMLTMIDHQAKIEPNIHITIIDGDKKGK